ncbi:MAG: putative 2-dehydropantoate 2-reductase, partial [Pirellulaceae bacterium]|nr:putative 2-dehydropantoate 2-reductase [Pirellulaceae bacterium]
MTSYAVLGVGALGGLYGGLLAHAGFDVHFLLHSDFEHVRQHGLKVQSPLGDFHLRSVLAYRDARDIPPVDVAIVAWKTTANAALPQALSGLLKETGCVLVLQNGWDIEQDSAQVVGAERVLGGCCFLCSNKVGPGHIHHLDYGRIAFGEYASSLSGAITPRLVQIESEFRSAGIDITATADLRQTRWSKLMWNIPFNGLSVVLNALTDRIMADPHTARLAESLMREVREAAAACGSSVDESLIDKLLSDTRKMVPYASSMLLDYQQGRPMEVEAIFGNPLRAAQAAGMSTPRIEMLYQQLKF